MFVRRFISKFDGECAQHITHKLGSWPVHLAVTPQYGNGLYATRRIKSGETVLREKPTCTTTGSAQDSRVEAIASRLPYKWKEDGSMVAQALSLVVQSAGWRPSGAPPSHYLLAMRSLGHTALPENEDRPFVKETLFKHLSEVFDLCSVPKGMWNPSECMLLYDKIKSNAFFDFEGTSVFTACSMINHSCRPNVGFGEPDDLRALRDISGGEQLFVSYGVRAEELPELYGFTCNCEECAPRNR
jgi:hypothetical protein